MYDPASQRRSLKSMRRKLALAFVLSSSVLAGCATMSPVQATDPATTGAVQPVHVEPASAAALFIGDAATNMDEKARNDYLVAQMSALDGKGKATFENEATGVQGSVESGPSALTALRPDMECRRYSSIVWVLGTGRLVEGDACRDKDGPWQAMGIRHEG
jgi:surface antigen